MSITFSYMNGFNNHFESEALAGALTRGQNSPQRVPFGLYAEQLSGSAFTMPRHANLFTWLYRIHPSVKHGEFELISTSNISPLHLDNPHTPPTQMRWDPLPYPKKAVNFIDGLHAFASNGSAESQTGATIYLYAATCSMQDEFFYDADGDLLIVPQEGGLQLKTELGVIEVMPTEIAVIPRGLKFQVVLLNEKARGYVCENMGAPFRLPDLGVIGANGLAHARDFQVPVAAFEERKGNLSLLVKFQGQLWRADIHYSPLDVVAWHGTYVPYKYDLKLFNTIGTVSFDHPDPSIFTVLTSPSVTPNVANVDFVIFPPRWMVAENTFRPPYYHRNIMSEYMGLIHGTYDAKQTGFVPGGSSLHNCMSAHGPDANAYQQALAAPLKPEFYDNTLAFMFESRHVWRLTSFAAQAPFRQKDYLACWNDLAAQFKTNASIT